MNNPVYYLFQIYTQRDGSTQTEQDLQLIWPLLLRNRFELHDASLVY
jgi:hypothetical protein